MENTANRELRIVRSFKAPLELIWEVWTRPEHIVHWWGPHGFTNTIHAMDFREGGEWKLTMHGPDGTSYPNRSIFREIVPLEKIVFEHFNPNFITTVLFEKQGEMTQIDWCLQFETAALRDIVVKAHKAGEGLKENLERLEKHLRQVSGLPS